MNQRVKGLIFVLAAPTLWGASGTLVETLFQAGVNPQWLVNIRLLCSGLCILAFSLLTKKDTFKIWRDKKDLPRLFIFSIFGVLAVQLTYFMSIHYSDSATATVLQFTNAVMISIVFAIRTRTLPRRADLISLAMAVLGVILLVTGGKFTSLIISPLGLFWGILSAMAAVSYTLLPPQLVRKYGAIPTVGWGMLISGIAFNFYQPLWQNVPQINGQNLLLIVLVILFGTSIPFVLFLMGLVFVKPTTASMLGAMEPLTAAVLGVFFLGITFDLSQIIGTLLVLGTVFIQALDKPKEMDLGKKICG